ncbi:hypothetical protein LCGC14_2143450, partial [marine sediment metagenome]
LHEAEYGRLVEFEMRGPPPKDPRLLTGHRRNRASTKATLPTEAEAAKRKVPPLPVLGGTAKWHPQVIEWWQDIWQSPMAAEFVHADRHGLYRLARLQQDFWRAPSKKDRVAIDREIRPLEAEFGLTPISRRRLQWEIARGEGAAEQTAIRRKRKRADPKKDPRDVLGLVK